MKNVHKELADIQKTVQKFSKLLDQIEKTVDGMTAEKTASKKGRKKKKAVRQEPEENQVNPPATETAGDGQIE